jgi:CRISPR/Cas system-associated exonuclease Cas4 (RecB family)
MGSKSIDGGSLAFNAISYAATCPIHVYFNKSHFYLDRDRYIDKTNMLQTNMEFLGTRIARDILTWGKESIKIDEENAKADIILDVGN